MNFELTEDQRMIVDAAAGFVRKQSPVTRMRKLRDDPQGWSTDTWRQMGELGWLGLAFPESLGGYGGSLVDVALVLEQLGTALVPEPIVSSLVAGMAILRAGDETQQKTWLAPMIAGQTTLALAWAERASRYDVTKVATTAERIRAGYRLSGHKQFVLDGHAADHLVVSARCDAAVALFVIDSGTPGVRVRPLRTLDGRRAAAVDLEDVVIGDDHRLGREGATALAYALDVGATAACAEGVGIMRAVLAMTAEYLRTREQFGVKIGSFQVLQHRAVDMFVELELAYSMALAAAIQVDQPATVSAAKAQLAESGRFVTQQAIQLHGGIGITDEHDVGLYFKRMHALNATYGDAEYHIARFALLQSAR